MRFIDLSFITFNWVKIGNVPFASSYGGGLSNRPTACIVNGRYSILYACSNGGNPAITCGAVLYSFDKNGGMCTYQTSDFVNGAFITSCCPGYNVFQSGNTFNYALLNGGNWKLTIPNVFKAGATFVLPATPVSFNSPCGGGDYLSTIYCSQQDIWCQEFIQDFPESSNYWASIYNGQNKLIGGGYIGNSFANLFNRTQTTLPPFTSTSDLYYKNGFNIYGNFGSAGAPYQVFGGNQPFLYGDPTELVCGGPGNPNVYVSGINQFQYFPWNEGGPSFNSGSSQLAQGTCDIAGFFLYPDSGTKFYFLSRDFIIAIKGLQGNGNCAVGLVGNKLYARVQPSQHYDGDVYITDFNPTDFGLAPLPIVGQSLHKGLVNYHRAVSPSGLFQA